MALNSFGKTVCRGKSIPSQTGLYNRLKGEVKRTVKRWPSAYASGQLVRRYKQQGGKYRCSSIGQPRCSSIGISSKVNSFGNLDRWFREKWVDTCTGKPCGRKTGSNRRYPYCRPSRKISGSTPRMVHELSSQEIKKRCAKKHRIKGQTLRFGSTKEYDDLWKEIEKEHRKSNISPNNFLTRLELARARYLLKKRQIKQQQKLERLSKKGTNPDAQPFVPRTLNFGKSLNY
jgi:hypothetical protein